LKKTDQGQGMKLKDQIIDKNFENVNIPPKKANQPLKKDEQILVDLVILHFFYIFRKKGK